MSEGDRSMNYRDRIRDFLDKGFFEPHHIARWVIDEISPEDYESVVNDLMISAVREVIRGRRNGQLARQRGQIKPQSMGSEPVHVPNVGWIDKPNLTADHCDKVADYYQQLASANQAKADEYRLMARSIRESGYTTLGDYLASNREKTKRGLIQAKQRGTLLGRPSKVTNEVGNLIVKLRDEKGYSLLDIANHLNHQHIPTGHGGIKWRGSSVRSVYLRMTQ